MWSFGRRKWYVSVKMYNLPIVLKVLDTSVYAVFTEIYVQSF
jgi:hypothetical protein